MRLLIVAFLFISQSLFAQAKRDSVLIETSVFTVMYSEILEQPLWIKYRSTNRSTNIDGSRMNFYKEKNIYTSNDEDYRANIWDKGQGAPAITFSDNIENLKQTFSYLNAIMQHRSLNKSEWRLLEEQERIWDDTENLTIIVKTFFDKPAKKVAAGAAIPSYIEKHIYFEKTDVWACYVFLNDKPKFKFWQLEKLCKDYEHNQ
jgi:DNA/RNA endonuclease G (NUC1)